MATKKKISARAREETPEPEVVKATFISVTPCTERIYANFNFTNDDGVQENKLYRVANWINYELSDNIASVGNFAYKDSMTLVTAHMLDNEPGHSFLGYVYD